MAVAGSFDKSLGRSKRESLTKSNMAAIAAAIGFGLILVFGVGLADAEALHAAAHDSRHTLGFPCH